jgi:predicted dehydrogenase
MKRRSLAVAGLGSFTQRVLLPGLLACERVRVDAAFTQSHARAAEMQAQYPDLRIFTNFARMLDVAQPEIVFVGTPNAAHVPMSIEAARRGCHVICEKPLAPTLQGAEAMAAAAKAAAIRTAVNFTFRSIGAARYAKHVLDEGRVGRVTHVALLYLQDIRHGADRPKVWRMDADIAGAGALGDVGSHAIDLVRWWCGDFAAVCGRSFTHNVEREGGAATNDDTAIFLAQLTSGLPVTLHISQAAAGRSNSLRVEVYGEEGGLVFTTERGTEPSVQFARPGEIGFTPLPIPEEFTVAYEAFPAYCAGRLVDTILGTDSVADFADGLAAQRVIDAVERAADGNAWIPLK